MTEPVQETHFSTSHEMEIYIRNPGETDWTEFDRGPGYFTIPVGLQVAVRVRMTDDNNIGSLVADLLPCRALVYLNLSENRNINDYGVEKTTALTWLSMLNLSSCAITNEGLADLKRFSRLEHLNLSYCNRITDLGLKTLRELRNLKYIDLQGCVKITTSGLTKLQRRGLTIHK